MPLCLLLIRTARSLSCRRAGQEPPGQLPAPPGPSPAALELCGGASLAAGKATSCRAVTTARSSQMSGIPDIGKTWRLLVGACGVPVADVAVGGQGSGDMPGRCGAGLLGAGGQDGRGGRGPSRSVGGCCLTRALGQIVRVGGWAWANFSCCACQETLDGGWCCGRRGVARGWRGQ